MNGSLLSINGALSESSLCSLFVIFTKMIFGCCKSMLKWKNQNLYIFRNDNYIVYEFFYLIMV